MPLETFDDVLASIAKNAGKRSFHLLLGNGFSMAYNPEIFSYNALHANQKWVQELGEMTTEARRLRRSRALALPGAR